MVLPDAGGRDHDGDILQGFENASVAVTVIVLKSPPELAPIEAGDADTVLFAALERSGLCVAWNDDGVPAHAARADTGLERVRPRPRFRGSTRRPWRCRRRR